MEKSIDLSIFNIEKRNYFPDLFYLMPKLCYCNANVFSLVNTNINIIQYFI